MVVVSAIAAAIAFLARAVSWFWAEDAVATSAARPWLGGMGTLDAVADRSPPLRANEASVKLTALANTLPKKDAVADFVARDYVRPLLGRTRSPDR